MGILKVLGWIFLPFIMIIIQWKRLNLAIRVVGGIYAFIILLAVIGNMTGGDDEVTTASAKADVSATATATVAPKPTATPKVLTEEEKKAIQHEKDKATNAAANKVKAEKVAAAAKARTALIEEQFSAWDGSHTLLKKMIKESMNDPKSFDHDETTYRDDGDYITVRMVYRGKNAFGGVVKDSTTAQFTIDGQFIKEVTE